MRFHTRTLAKLSFVVHTTPCHTRSYCNELLHVYVALASMRFCDCWQPRRKPQQFSMFLPYALALVQSRLRYGRRPLRPKNQYGGHGEARRELQAGTTGRNGRATLKRFTLLEAVLEALSSFVGFLMEPAPTIPLM